MNYIDRWGSLRLFELSLDLLVLGKQGIIELLVLRLGEDLCSIGSDMSGAEVDHVEHLILELLEIGFKSLALSWC
jgi:hypothetical protein